MYNGMGGYWKVAGLVRDSSDMTRLAQCIGTDATWSVVDGEMIVKNAAGVELARLPVTER